MNSERFVAIAEQDDAIANPPEQGQPKEQFSASGPQREPEESRQRPNIQKRQEKLKPFFALMDVEGFVFDHGACISHGQPCAGNTIRSLIGSMNGGEKHAWDRRGTLGQNPVLGNQRLK